MGHLLSGIWTSLRGIASDLLFGWSLRIRPKDGISVVQTVMDSIDPKLWQANSARMTAKAKATLLRKRI